MTRWARVVVKRTRVSEHSYILDMNLVLTDLMEITKMFISCLCYATVTMRWFICECVLEEIISEMEEPMDMPKAYALPSKSYPNLFFFGQLVGFGRHLQPSTSDKSTRHWSF